jgi:hypothetical protein
MRKVKKKLAVLEESICCAVFSTKAARQPRPKVGCTLDAYWSESCKIQIPYLHNKRFGHKV